MGARAADPKGNAPSEAFTRRVANTLLKFPVRRDVRGVQPASISQIAADITGVSSTHAERPDKRTRMALAELEDRALRSIWAAAVAQHGEAHAVYVIFRLVARDESYEPPEWLREHFEAHRTECYQAAQDAAREREQRSA